MIFSPSLAVEAVDFGLFQPLLFFSLSFLSLCFFSLLDEDEDDEEDEDERQFSARLWWWRHFLQNGWGLLPLYVAFESSTTPFLSLVSETLSLVSLRLWDGLSTLVQTSVDQVFELSLG